MSSRRSPLHRPAPSLLPGSKYAHCPYPHHPTPPELLAAPAAYTTHPSTLPKRPKDAPSVYNRFQSTLWDASYCSAPSTSTTPRPQTVSTPPNPPAHRLARESVSSPARTPTRRPAVVATPAPRPQLPPPS